MFTWRQEAKQPVVFCGINTSTVNAISRFGSHNKMLYTQLLPSPPWSRAFAPRDFGQDLEWGISTLIALRGLLRVKAGFAVPYASGQVVNIVREVTQARYAHVLVELMYGCFVVGLRVSSIQRLRPFIERPNELTDVLVSRFGAAYYRPAHKELFVNFWTDILAVATGAGSINRGELPSIVTRTQTTVANSTVFDKLFTCPPDIAAYERQLSALMTSIAQGRKIHADTVSRMLRVAA